MKRLYIIHGWGGNPEESIFPWLKNEAKNKGFKVEVPAMPNPDEPKIGTWVPYIKKIVGKVDKDTYFVGHSIGCQAIMRYLEGIDTKFGGIIFIAGFVHLKPETFKNEDELNRTRPWLETPINFDKIKNNKYICIFSDNDDCVPLTDSEIFKEKLNAKIIIEHNKGHFSEIKKLPSALESLLEISK